MVSIAPQNFAPNQLDQSPSFIESSHGRCRICLQEDLLTNLLQVCRCEVNAHSVCMIAWISACIKKANQQKKVKNILRFIKCQICRQHFNVTRQKHYKLIDPFSSSCRKDLQIRKKYCCSTVIAIILVVLIILSVIFPQVNILLYFFLVFFSISLLVYLCVLVINKCISEQLIIKVLPYENKNTIEQTNNRLVSIRQQRN